MFVSVEVKLTVTLPVEPPRVILLFAVVADKVVVVELLKGLIVITAV
jgi:hypothetical protein